MKLRVARHTANLQSLIDFYKTILGLDVIGDFKDHAGYNGVFIGGKNAGWHLEFTESTDKPDHTADDDDLLVFYVSHEDYTAIIEKMAANNIAAVLPKNPYWKDNGVMMLDPDGFKVVVSVQKS